MESNPAKDRSPRILNLLPFYYGWFIVALSFLANLTAAGIRSAPSVLIHPLGSGVRLESDGSCFGGKSQFAACWVCLRRWADG